MNVIKTKSFELAINTKGDENALKLAILLPGRLDTKDYAHIVSHVDYMASRGYFAISFDPPGTWDSPGSIDLYTMTNYKKAVNEIIEYFGNKPTVLMGHSRGGSMAMLTGPSNNHVTHIIAVMSNVAPSKLKSDDAQDGVNISYRDMPPNDRENKKRFDLPMNYFVDATKHDILGGLRKCDKPKLLFYGTKDVLVSPDRVKETYEESLGPKVIYELDTEHDYRFHDDIIAEVEEKVGEFLDKY